MAGYFSNSGEGDSPNAAKQFEREFADNPGSFGGEGGGREMHVRGSVGDDESVRRVLPASLIRFLKLKDLRRAN